MFVYTISLALILKDSNTREIITHSFFIEH